MNLMIGSAGDKDDEDVYDDDDVDESEFQEIKLRR